MYIEVAPNATRDSQNTILRLFANKAVKANDVAHIAIIGVLLIIIKYWFVPVLSSKSGTLIASSARDILHSFSDTDTYPAYSPLYR